MSASTAGALPPLVISLWRTVSLLEGVSSPCLSVCHGMRLRMSSSVETAATTYATPRSSGGLTAHECCMPPARLSPSRFTSVAKPRRPESAISA